MMECGIGGFGSIDEDGQLMSMELSGVEGGGEVYTLANEEKGGKVGRHPRWSQHETLILIEAKREEDAKSLRAREEREKGTDTSLKNVNGESKWISISRFCDRHGVSRSAAQCRKRWCNLSSDYKRIRDWHSFKERPLFWVLSNDLRKEKKLPGCFDREVYDCLDNNFRTIPCASPEIIFDSGCLVSDECLFSDIELSVQEGDAQACSEKEATGSSPPLESHVPMPDACEEQCEEKFDAGGLFAEEADVPTRSRKKRKRTAVVPRGHPPSNWAFGTPHASETFMANKTGPSNNKGGDCNLLHPPKLLMTKYEHLKKLNACFCCFEWGHHMFQCLNC